jgi:ABC-2 type transport system ATP-binding protein
MTIAGQVREIAMKEPTIDVQGVSKWFGNFVAVNDITVQTYPGITGLLGPNGSGKTTLLRMISGLSKPSVGQVRLLGEPVRGNPRIYRRIGVMPEHDVVYGFCTGRELVELAAQLYGLNPSGPAVDRAIETMGMTDVQYRAVGTYSRGMRQRIRMAAALVHEPEVLLLDEPLNGMDPRQRLETQDLLRHLADEGCTILLSSHILEEVETLAERIVLMVSGKLAASGNLRAIREKLDQRSYRIRIVASNPRALASALIQSDAVDSVAVAPGGAMNVRSSNVAILQQSVPQLARDLGIRLFRVEPLDESLESVFSYVVER